MNNHVNQAQYQASLSVIDENLNDGVPNSFSPTKKTPSKQLPHDNDEVRQEIETYGKGTMNQNQSLNKPVFKELPQSDKTTMAHKPLKDNQPHGKNFSS